MEILKQVSQPTYTVYLPSPSRASGAAILIFPGGGYSALSWDMEGRWIAMALQDRGIAGVLVKYRLPSDEIMANKSIGPLQDGQQAILQVRRHAASWGINPRKVGALGFSAGGHLASMLGTSFGTAVVPNPDGINVRPDFLMLIYAITSFADGRVNADVRRSLLGDHPTAEVVTEFSTELHVTDNTPPTLLLAASNDEAVGYDHALNFYSALRKHNVSAELVLFERGQHGFFELDREEWWAPIWGWLVRNGTVKR
jgi:acetyl esterase/lipase